MQYLVYVIFGYEIKLCSIVHSVRLYDVRGKLADAWLLKYTVDTDDSGTRTRKVWITQ